MARALLVGVAVGLALTGCTDSASIPARAVSSTSTPVAPDSAVAVAAPELVRCPAGGATALSAALPGTRWTDAAVTRPSGGVCVLSLQTTSASGGGSGSVQVTYAPTSTATRAVAGFRASPPALAGAKPLGDLDVGAPSAGVRATADGRLMLLLQGARPAYLVSVEAALPANGQGSARQVAQALLSWALAQQPR